MSILLNNRKGVITAERVKCYSCMLFCTDYYTVSNKTNCKILKLTLYFVINLLQKIKVCNDSIFITIVAVEIPGKIVYEDDICLAFLDLSQTTNGHTLVIPKAHFKNILEVDDKTLIHLMSVTKRLANMIVTNLNAKGVNILTNANEAAGQTVMHFHIHIIPRYNQNDQITSIYYKKFRFRILNKIKAEMN